MEVLLAPTTDNFRKAYDHILNDRRKAAQKASGRQDVHDFQTKLQRAVDPQAQNTCSTCEYCLGMGKDNYIPQCNNNHMIVEFTIYGCAGHSLRQVNPSV